MNELVFDSNEVLIFLFLFFVFEKVKIRGGIVVVVIKHTKGHEVLLFTHPLLRSKTECFSFQKTGTRESRERGSIGERERGRERERADHGELGGRFFMIATQGISPNSLSLVSLHVDLNPYPKSPFMFSFFFSFVLTDC